MSEAASPRPLEEQTVVITGASSGIGRETALRMAARGASVVLAARNEEALSAVAAEIRATGVGRALVVPTDVADSAQVQRLADLTLDGFGRIDTWVNDAAVSEYCLIEKQDLFEIERIVRVNLLGTIYGIKAALPVMRAQNSGTIINIASVLAERAIPLQGIYCATKHAVKGFTEALRLELKHENSPINVSLILPSVINTPFYTSAGSRMGVRPRPLPPRYDAGVVADTIVFAATHPRRDLYAGGFGKMLALMEQFSGPLTDWYMLQGGRMFKAQQSDQPDDGRSNLFNPIPGKGSVSGGYDKTLSFSPYTRFLELHPSRKRLVAAAVLAGAFALLASRRRHHS